MLPSCFSMKSFMNSMYSSFPPNLPNINKKRKNYLLEIYTKERDPICLLFYVLTERLEPLTWYCWQESGWFWQWGSNFWQLFLEGILEKNQIFIYNTKFFLSDIIKNSFTFPTKKKKISSDICSHFVPIHFLKWRDFKHFAPWTLEFKNHGSFKT